MQANNIEKVKVGQKANLPKEELAQLTITVIDQLIADCRYVNCDCLCCNDDMYLQQQLSYLTFS